MLRPRRALPAALLTVLAGVSGCGSGDAPSADATRTASVVPGTGIPAPGPPAEAPPPSAAPATPTIAPAPAATAVADGISVPVPAGWQVTAMTPPARAEALARQTDPRVVTFLEERLEGLAAQGAVLYLYDLRRADAGELATAEVYRYPAGRTPEAALEQVVLPRLEQAGFAPVRGEVALPAGLALTAVSELQVAGQSVRSEVFVLPLGPTTAGLSVTMVGAFGAVTEQLAQGLAQSGP